MGDNEKNDNNNDAKASSSKSSETYSGELTTEQNMNKMSPVLVDVTNQNQLTQKIQADDKRYCVQLNPNPMTDNAQEGSWFSVAKVESPKHSSELFSQIRELADDQTISNAFSGSRTREEFIESEVKFVEKLKFPELQMAYLVVLEAVLKFALPSLNGDVTGDTTKKDNGAVLSSLEEESRDPAELTTSPNYKLDKSLVQLKEDGSPEPEPESLETPTGKGLKRKIEED